MGVCEAILAVDCEDGVGLADGGVWPERRPRRAATPKKTKRIQTSVSFKLFGSKRIQLTQRGRTAGCAFEGGEDNPRFGELDEDGTVTFPPHDGQVPEVPHIESSVAIRCPQWMQWNFKFIDPLSFSKF